MGKTEFYRIGSIGHLGERRYKMTDLGTVDVPSDGDVLEVAAAAVAQGHFIGTAEAQAKASVARRSLETTIERLVEERVQLKQDLRRLADAIDTKDARITDLQSDVDFLTLDAQALTEILDAVDLPAKQLRQVIRNVSESVEESKDILSDEDTMAGLAESEAELAEVDTSGWDHSKTENGLVWRRTVQFADDVVSVDPAVTK